MNNLEFRRSSYSGGSNNCIEVADSPTRHAVRDSKTLEQTPLVFPSSEWRAFLSTATDDQR